MSRTLLHAHRLVWLIDCYLMSNGESMMYEETKGEYVDKEGQITFSNGLLIN